MIPHETIFSWFPANRTKDLADMDLLIATKMEFQFEVENDKVIVKRKGEIVRDKMTLDPLPPAQVMKDYFAERNWIAKSNDAAQGLKTLSSFTEKWRAANPGKTELCPEFDSDLQKHVAEAKDFDYYN